MTGTRGEATIYWERQDRKNCQVHALNAMLGRQVVTGPQVSAFLDALPLEARGGYITRTMSGRAGTYDEDGNFADMTINMWIQHNLQHGITAGSERLYLVHTHSSPIPRGSSEAHLLKHVPTDHDSFTVCWFGGSAAYVGRYGHSVCICKHSDQWYLNDSKPVQLPAGWKSAKHGPQPMTSELWGFLKGKVRLAFVTV